MFDGPDDAMINDANFGLAAREVLEEIVRVLDAHERGEPFGDDEVGSMPLLPYIHDLARAALPSRKTRLASETDQPKET